MHRITVIDRQDKTVCAACEEVLDPAWDGASERAPCPKCGSTSRSISVVLTENIQATDAIIARFSKATIVLALQTVVTLGSKTSDGAIVEAVTVPWLELVQLMQQDPRVVHEIPARRWEEIIAGAYTKAGFDEVILTPQSGDHGRDVIAIKKGLGSVRVIDQVKAFRPGHLVTANDVRALMGVLQTDGASKGFLTTTSDFAPRLSDDPLIRPLIPSKLELINGKALLQRLSELAKD